MKSTLSLLALLFAFFLSSKAQQPDLKLNPHQHETRKLVKPQATAMNFADQPLLGSPKIAPTSLVESLKTQSSILLGSSSNVYTTLRPYQNQVIAVDSLGLVAFIHRQDASVFGGDPGLFRYDISTDGGDSWAIDVGPLQQTNTNSGRYPNIAAYNPGSTSPLDVKMVYGGPSTNFPTPGWVGHVYGVADVGTTSGQAVPATEHYLFAGDPTFIQGSLVRGLPGEFWMVENQFDGTDITDTIRVLQGVWNPNTSDVDWTLAHNLAPGYDKSFDGTVWASSPVIGFSPDGMNGWIAMTGNIINGNDNRQGALLPIFIRTTDGGATWDPAYEVDLSAIPWIYDSLTSLWAIGTGVPFCLFENFDLTVDKEGNPHLGLVIYNSDSTDDFSFFPGLEKILADVYSTDGGATWDASYLAPILTFDNQYGSGGNVVRQTNHVQAARTEAGDYLFFSWVDSDTSQFTGSMNGIGFGEVTNLAPNLRIVAKRVSDLGQAYPRTITDSDLNWQGQILFPTMSPIVIEKNGEWRLPIVATDMPTGPIDPVKFYYWGNDATYDIATTDFCQWQTMDLGWVDWGDPGFVSGSCVVSVDPGTAQKETLLHQCYPNPSAGDAVIRFHLTATSNLSLDLLNAYGQQVAALASGEFQSGAHEVKLETGDLASGIYFYRFRTDPGVRKSEVFTGKLILSR